MNTTLLNTSLGALLLTVVTAIPGYAVSCGTIASPTACQFAGPNITFSLSNFNIGAQVGYQASDIAIDLFGSGSLITLTFTKDPNGPTPGVSFFANPGESRGFSFSYNLALTPTAGGTVEIDSLTADMTGNQNGNAFGQIQVITPGAPTCLMPVQNTNHADCTLLPTIGSSSLFGNIVTLTGGNPTGNVAILQFSNTITGEFTPASTGVPEPSTYGLVGGALTLLALTRRKA